MRFFITGSAGFIGFHLARRLLDDGHVVHGYDGMTAYYDRGLKQARRDILKTHNDYVHVEVMLEDMAALSSAATTAQPDIIVHLAAQAGVRYSLENPRAYVDSNLSGTFNVLEVARQLKVRHLLLASTSSVYGGGTNAPSRESDESSQPLTLYAATKKSVEVMAHAYAHLWRIPTTVFRPFTIYGPYGRPDMALFRFVEAAEKNEPIEIYGDGRHMRDFTYIDDLVEAMSRLIRVIPGPVLSLPTGVSDTLSADGPIRVVNIGGGQPVELTRFIGMIEACLGRPITRRILPEQKGDALHTCAGPDLLQALTGYRPATPLEDGIAAFVQWYRTRPI